MKRQVAYRELDWHRDSPRAVMVRREPPPARAIRKSQSVRQPSSASQMFAGIKLRWTADGSAGVMLWKQRSFWLDTRLAEVSRPGQAAVLYVLPELVIGATCTAAGVDQPALRLNPVKRRPFKCLLRSTV